MKVRNRTDFIVVHCSATPPDLNIGRDKIKEWHLANGWEDIGYHYVIRRDGSVETGRAENLVGSHVKNYNSRSVGICLVGGVDKKGHAENNFTVEQFKTLIKEIKYFKAKYPHATVLGHRDLSPDINGDGKITSNEWIKECPSFDVAKFLVDNKL